MNRYPVVSIASGVAQTTTSIGTASIGALAAEEAVTRTVKSEPHYHPMHDHGLVDPLGFAMVVAVGVCVREAFGYFR
jgi:hypothetical protein